MLEYLIIAAIVIFVGYKILKKRGYFWKDKAGNKLQGKEFMKRWAKGIEGITPVQQTRTMILGTWLIITGIVWGLVVVAMSGTWWMFIILIGSLPITIMQMVGLYQKYAKQKTVEKTMSRIEKEAKYVG